MVIVSTKIIEKGIQANGNKLIQYEFIDHLDNIYLSSAKHVSPDFDIASDLELRKNRKEQELKDIEINNFLEKLSNNINPFRDKNNVEIEPIYQTKDVALARILTYVLNLPSDKVIKYLPAVQFLKILTDSELIKLLNIDQIKVDDIRVWETNIAIVNDILSKYKPILGGNE